MRKGWEYKKLGEVCTIKAGYTPKKNELSDNGAYPYYKVADMNTLGNDVYLDITSSYKIDANKLFPKGAIVFPKNGAAVSTNKKRILKYDSIVDLNTGVAIFPKSINEKFAYYWFIDTDFKKYVRGGALPTLDIKSLKDKPFPSIDKSTQFAIVSELDKINELIRLKKEQLKDFDYLAQSLFYEMFGDPVENEKGWEVKKLKEIVSDNCSISYGIVQPGDGVENGVPVVRPVDMTKTFVSRKGLKNTTKEISDSYKRTILKGNEILMCVRGTTGLISMATPELQGCNVTRGIAPIECGPTCDKWFVFYQILNPAIQHHIAEYTRGIALKQINMKDVRDIPLCLPPLSLQRLFAQRIEQIEREKSEVQKSIQDLETLLASRMQYWFE